MKRPVPCNDCGKIIYVETETINKYKETGDEELIICQACIFANSTVEVKPGTFAPPDQK
jgi:hypothetical protein